MTRKSTRIFPSDMYLALIGLLLKTRILNGPISANLICKMSSTAKLWPTGSPQKIILFGSYARGNFGQDSDLDLFIAVEGGKESSRSIRRKIDGLLWGRRFPIDLIVKNKQEIEWNFKAKNSFYLHHIFKEGKVLYEKKC